MRLIVDLLIVTLLAAGIGLGLTAYAVRNPPGLDAVQAGAWRTDTTRGTPQIDAYLLAAVAYRGEIPLAVGDGISFAATRDDDGEVLRARCTYRISGAVPDLRIWTISAYDEDGGRLDNAARRFGFASTELVRDSDRSVEIVVSPQAQPGNWLPVSGGGEIALVLRFYETTIGALSGGRPTPQLPAIERRGCQ